MEDDKSMTFKYADNESMSLKELTEKSEGRNYEFTACIKWVSTVKSIEIKNRDGTTTTKRLREAVVMDSSKSFCQFGKII